MCKTRVSVIFAILSLGFVAFLGAPFGAGCGSDGQPTDGGPLGNVGSVCSADADCNAGLTCQEGICKEPAPAPKPDADLDGVADDVDNCVDVANTDQADADADGIGNACEDDDDNDGVLDSDDNCQFTVNAGQEDLDGDGVGDACDGDKDGDTVADAGDNCLDTPNADQADLDADGIGNACDTDADGDGFISVAMGGDDCNDLAATTNPMAEDKPDLPNYTDSNCDGIDGDKVKAIWVSPTGSDSNTGRFLSPLKTIQKAINKAALGPIKDIYVITNVPRTESTINVNYGSAEGIYGGFAPDGMRDVSVNSSVIQGRWVISNSAKFEGMNLVYNNNSDSLTTVQIFNVSPIFNYVNIFRGEARNIFNVAVLVEAGGPGPTEAKPQFNNCWIQSSDCVATCNSSAVYAVSENAESVLELTIKNSPYIGPSATDINIGTAVSIFSVMPGGISRLVMDGNKYVTGSASGSVSSGLILGYDILANKYQEFTSAQITRNKIYGGNGISGTYGAFVFKPSEQVLFENNFIHGGLSDASHHMGLYLINMGDKVHVVHNTINSGKNGPMSAGMVELGAGLESPTIENNIFFGESTKNYGVYESSDVAPQSLQGNLFDSSLDTLYYDFTLGDVTDIADVNSMTGSASNISADAMSFLVDVSSLNHHLLAGSPAIDRAVPGLHTPTTSVDYDGDARPVGGASDIGADELK